MMSVYHYQHCSVLDAQQNRAVLELQSFWVRPAPSHFQEPEKDALNGFLISKFNATELSEVLSERGSILLASNRKQELRGYILSTPITEFTNLYKDPIDGSFAQELRTPSIHPNWRYLYQMVVHPDEQKTGLAYEILQRFLALNSNCVLTDVLTNPIANDRSIQFFLKNQFKEYGTLTLSQYREFGELKSKVLVWKP